ncbi:hypothetical protein IFM89_025165 [Coptis chinensis]|uniref:Matrin-type domain-containing protein n=1 Tax=Coptis chinensis TaxID=261450 RepID=A0A835HJW9_9MAGN|nr:hypothetical protein IFM89_025165 [Coptis chinensis]
MSSTLLEVTRSSHEEVERLERLIVKDLQKEPASSRERLFQNHRVRNMIDSITSTTHKLVEIYEDKDSARKDEIAALGGQSGNTNVFGAFYDRLKEIREYHRRHPSARVIDASEDYDELLKDEPLVEFSGEEGYGRYFDMHELYNEYINSKFGKLVEYSTYLDIFSQTHEIPRNLKLTGAYKEYLEHLLEYLIHFFQRIEPLQDLDRFFSKALSALGLKSGGTVKERAERLFLTKHTPLEQLDKKHFLKGSCGVKQNGTAAVSERTGDLKNIALMEAKLKRLCEDLLNEIIVQTKENVEKKQALTFEEMEAEREEEEVQADSESDDDEQQIYNPLKLPMGWDGKPIPYWLYKLHGLGQEFKCEICGNHSYWGRRAFERHFKEWRHQHGMRCLGIPNTKNFNEVTSIEEAQELWRKIQQRQGVNKWRPEEEEEYEDKEGNIYNKKTYTDLQRQGLL